MSRRLPNIIDLQFVTAALAFALIVALIAVWADTL